MNRARHIAASILLALAATGCVDELVPIFPTPAYEAVLAGTTPVPDSAKRRIEGVYEVVDGRQRFGPQVVLKYSGDILSIFSETNVAFMVLRGGVRDSSIVYTGTWRFAQSESTGRVELTIAADAGGAALLAGSAAAQPVLSGASGGPSVRSQLNNELTLRYLRPLSRLSERFWNIAHRGGGRNSDRHLYSENSVPMIMYASQLGANGVEIDVRLTKDEVPILFHDAEFTTRLVNGTYMTGSVSNYTYDEINTFARLKMGERVPTLAEALDTIVNATDLSLVWLDIKDPASVPVMILLVSEYEARAKAMGRELRIFHGIPDRAILEAYIAAGGPGANALCELTVEETRRVDAAVWAPRWTLGTLNSEVDQMHAEGRFAFVWTLDVPSFITAFLDTGDFDGILTNFPTLVAYYAYSRE